MGKQDPNKLLEECVEAFNYPEENGENADYSIEAIDKIIKKLKKGTIHWRIAKWMSDELSKSYEVEMEIGEGSPYNLARIVSMNSEAPIIEVFHFEKKVWEKIPI